MLNGRFAAGKDDNVLIRDLLRLNIDIIYIIPSIEILLFVMQHILRN